MQRTAVIEQLRMHIAQNVLEDKDVGLDETTPLLEWGIINSLEVVRLIDFMSRQFKVDITPDKLSANHFTNISTIADLVMENLPGEA